MTPEVTIRQEMPEDHKEVFHLIAEAFKEDPISDHREQFLVERLRQSKEFISELSLVAEHNGSVVGHILLTPIQIRNDVHSTPSLALAPVSVLPAMQGKGIGSLLTREAHARATDLGHQSVVLLGHADYYPRFGYRRAAEYGITLPFDVPEEYCMAIELVAGGLNGVSGVVVYPPAFSG